MHDVSTFWRLAALASALASMALAASAQSAVQPGPGAAGATSLDAKGYRFAPGPGAVPKLQVDRIAAAVGQLGWACEPGKNKLDANSACPTGPKPRPRKEALVKLTLCTQDLFALGAGECLSGPINVAGMSDGLPKPVAPNSPQAEQAAEQALILGMAALIRHYGLPVTLEPMKAPGPIPEWLGKAAQSTRETR